MALPLHEKSSVPYVCGTEAVLSLLGRAGKIPACTSDACVPSPVQVFRASALPLKRQGDVFLRLRDSISRSIGSQAIVWVIGEGWRVEKKRECGGNPPHFSLLLKIAPVLFWRPLHGDSGDLFRGQIEGFPLGSRAAVCLFWRTPPGQCFPGSRLL